MVRTSAPAPDAASEPVAKPESSNAAAYSPVVPPYPPPPPAARPLPLTTAAGVKAPHASGPTKLLLIADALPPEAASLHRLIENPDYCFTRVPLQAAERIAREDAAAAVILATPDYFHGRQKNLVRVLDQLSARRLGAVLVTCTDEDRALAEQMCAADGMLAVTLRCGAEELAGRLMGLAAIRPVIEGLHRENALLRRADTGLHSRISEIDEEMRLAARLQKDFLPRDIPSVNGVHFDVFFRPAAYVSGDIYDISRLDEHHIGFFVADAVGHGMPAALLTIFLKTSLITKEIPAAGQEDAGGAPGYRLVPPNEALTRLNQELYEQQLSLCQFVTMIYGILDTRTLTLQWSRAGHPSPMHLRPDGQAADLELEGALLGIFPEEPFALETTQLHPGEALLLYTDGFESAFSDTAAPNNLINECYRTEFTRLACPGPRAAFAQMVQTLDAQAGSLHQRDDLTALLLSIE